MPCLATGHRIDVNMRRPVVLIVDDDPQVRKTLEILLAPFYETISVDNGRDAVAAVGKEPVDMVLMDVSLPVMDGLTALEKIKALERDVGVIMISATDSAEKAVSALKKGAYDYITKPFDTEDLLSTLGRFTDRLALKNRVEYLSSELWKDFVYCEIISKSPRMKKVFDVIGKVSRASSNVLITGESGTGKELVAKAIHAISDRREKPFVAVNCGAVPSELMESELFGHEKGAFTGAVTRKIGKFEHADGGTVFLDEVSTLPMHLQIKLLRVLQERTFERIGSNIPIKVDLRIIAASNINLEEAVRKGVFREDLFYRLNVVPIELPPLRERKEDIPILAAHFLDKHSKNCNKKVTGITGEALEALQRYPWPGNVRELENLIERLVVLAREGEGITVDDLPAEVLYTGLGMEGEEVKDFRAAIKSFERRLIIGVLEKTNWNRVEAARMMKMHRNTLLIKMKALDIKEPERASRLDTVSTLEK